MKLYFVGLLTCCSCKALVSAVVGCMREPLKRSLNSRMSMLATQGLKSCEYEIITVLCALHFAAVKENSVDAEACDCYPGCLVC